MSQPAKDTTNLEMETEKDIETEDEEQGVSGLHTSNNGNTKSAEIIAGPVSLRENTKSFLGMWLKYFIHSRAVMIVQSMTSILLMLGIKFGFDSYYNQIDIIHSNQTMIQLNSIFQILNFHDLTWLILCGIFTFIAVLCFVFCFCFDFILFCFFFVYFPFRFVSKTISFLFFHRFCFSIFFLEIVFNPRICFYDFVVMFVLDLFDISIYISNRMEF